MRWWALLILVSTAAAADDGIAIRARRLAEPQPEPWLHLDTLPDFSDAAGGMTDGQATLFELGPRTRLAVEGKWWQTGLAPSMFATDLDFNGWSASAEISYDLGPFHVGVNASMARFGDSSHRAVGLFAYKSFRFSRWTRLWIVLGLSFEQWDGPSHAGPRRGTNVGLSIGGTFR